MEIEIFTLCDYAQDMAGKLVIVGTFDTIWAPSFPNLHPACAIAARIRFERMEAGRHTIKLFIVDQDGKEVLPPLQAEINPIVPPGYDFATVNFSVNIAQLKLMHEGRFSIDLLIDGNRERSLPIYARTVRKPGPPNQADGGPQM
jgi:hypothetical protein